MRVPNACPQQGNLAGGVGLQAREPDVEWVIPTTGWLEWVWMFQLLPGWGPAWAGSNWASIIGTAVQSAPHVAIEAVWGDTIVTRTGESF